MSDNFSKTEHERQQEAIREAVLRASESQQRPPSLSEQETALFLLHGAEDKDSRSNNGLSTQHRGWVLAFTRLHKIPVFRRVWVYLFVMGIYAFLVDWLAEAHLPQGLLKEAGAAAYGSVVLGLLLVFRTNTAYERWAEGRKLWGQLVNDSRNLAFKVRNFIAVTEQEKVQFGQLVISFSYALKHHLRNTTPTEPLPGLGRANMEGKNMPVHVTGKIYELIQQWRKAGLVDTLMLIELDFQLRGFMDVCGACERIKNSPIAVSYRAFMRQGIVLNLIVVPWLLCEYPIIWCLPMILVGTYFLIGLELIAEDIEEPFGKDGDDLPLDTICATIRTSITEILGMTKSMKYTQTVDTSHFRDPLKTTHI